MEPFLDFLELVGLKSVYNDSINGKLILADAIKEVKARREIYPNVNQDYVDYINYLLDILKQLEDRAIEEEEILKKFNQKAAPFNLHFPYVPGKVMTTEEALDFEILNEELKRLLEDAAFKAMWAEREIEDLMKENEQLSRDAEEEIEDALKKVREAQLEVEEAQQDLEDYEYEKARSEKQAEKKIEEMLKLLSELLNWAGINI